jgi:hypothetical protein
MNTQPTPETDTLERTTLNPADYLKMTDHLSNPEGHPESVDEKPTNRRFAPSTN